MRKLNDNELDKVNGGYIFHNGNQWEIIDDATGRILELVPKGDGDGYVAQARAEGVWHVSKSFIFGPQLNELRKRAAANN